jgi:hypothetical protein
MLLPLDDALLPTLSALSAPGVFVGEVGSLLHAAVAATAIAARNFME